MGRDPWEAERSKLVPAKRTRRQPLVSASVRGKVKGEVEWGDRQKWCPNIRWGVERKSKKKRKKEKRNP